MAAPLIDKRNREAIIAETAALAQAYTGWKPPAEGQPDAGLALIHIFGRFAELIIERVNRAPENNLLAFLNLIGTEVLPPRPARVPLTFRLATNSPVDAALPATTQAAAPPLEGEEEEVIFETERDLVVTRSQLKAVFVRDTETDCYSDRSGQAFGEKDEAFAAFQGDQAVPHELYIACDELLTQQGEKKVTLILKSPDMWQWTTWPIEWSYWDGEEWQSKHPSNTRIEAGAWQVTFDQLPKLEPHTVNGVEAGWLRGRLDLPMIPGKKDLVPESVASGGNEPQDLELPYNPFGETASIKSFDLSADEAFQVGGAILRLHISLAQPGTRKRGTTLRLKWSFEKAEGEWVELDPANFDLADETKAFTLDGEVRFRIPVDWQRILHATRKRRWLRVEIAAGQYSRRPRIESLRVSYDWELPKITAISVLQQDTPQPLRPEMAFFNSGAIDLNKDFYPFGEQPRYNDTFYVACEQALAKPKEKVTLKLTLVNPPDVTAPVKTVNAKGNPKLAWAVWNGRDWQEVTSTRNPATFTENENFTFNLPPAIASTTINGEEKHWLRARLVDGNYGVDAQVQSKTFTVTTTQDGKATTTEYQGYETVPATYAPPLVQSIEFIQEAKAERTTPVSACLTNNDFAYHDHTAVAATQSADAFPVFTHTEDTRPALYLGLDQPFDPRPTTLYLRAEAPRPEQVAADKLAEVDSSTPPRVTWEYAGPAGWTPLGALDQTQGLARRDLVHFIGPDDLKSRHLFGQPLYWLRLRWRGGEFPLMPRLRRVVLNTTWATQVTTSRHETLGSSNGNAGQTFQTAQAPVQPGQQLQVREPEMPGPAEKAVLQKRQESDAITVTLDAAGHPDEIWVCWHPVPDFYSSGPRDRHYVIDAVSGEVRFGDGQYGLVPAVGQNNIRVTYRTGGGAHGNRAANTIVQLKSSVPYIDSVINHEPASAGAEQESLDRVKERGPRHLRHRDRTVTAQDLEDLAQEADPDVARVRAIVPTFHPTNLWLDLDGEEPATGAHAGVAAGRMGAIVVPRSEAIRPTPSLSLLRRVKAYLLARCPTTTELWVAGPEWVKVTVEATIVPASLAQADAVSEQIKLTLDRFIHPLTGGPTGRGWAFGRAPQRSDLYAVIEALAGVDHVRALKLTSDAHAGDADLKLKLDRRLGQPQKAAVAESPAPAAQRWLDRSLVYSGWHRIRTILENA